MMLTSQELEQMAKRMRIRALEMAITAGRDGVSAHLGGSFSAMEIFAVLYSNVLRYDPKNMKNDDRDRFFVSKAHCTLAQYTAMAEAGILEDCELNTYMKNGSPLMGYPQDLSRGLEYSGGSLGMALSFAEGVAFGLKNKKSESRVYVLLGDGECEEGLHWEVFMFAARHCLDNLTVIIDRNGLQLAGTTEEIAGIGRIEDKLNTFGWETECIDGHNTEELLRAFDKSHQGKPYAIIAKTVKGKGLSFIENRKEGHQYLLKEAEYETALKELGGE